MAKLKKSRKKKKKTKNEVHEKILSVKELYKENWNFKNQALNEIENETSKFKISKQEVRFLFHLYF